MIQVSDESTPLTSVTDESMRDFFHLPRSCKTFCVRSKPAFLLLLTSFAVSLGCGYMFDPSVLSWEFSNKYISTTGAIVLFLALVVAISPIAGLMADIKFGRYKIILCSSYTSMVMTLISSTGVIVLFIFYSSGFLPYSGAVVICYFITTLFLTTGYFFIFSTNIVQFGMDQLFESPSSDSSLFIHWYVWQYYVSLILFQFIWAMLLHDYSNLNQRDRALDLPKIIGMSLFVVIGFVSVLLHVIAIFFLHQKKTCFHIEPGRVSPYKLLYRVLLYSYHNKRIVYRSAFTYCEDEMPTRLDHSKTKYGGPFTNEQVEDVKTFFRILKVLFFACPVFMIDLAAKSTLVTFSDHGTRANRTAVELHNWVVHMLVIHGLLHPLVVVVCIPIYICLFRPWISNWIPGMLTRLGIGMILSILTLAVNFSMDVYVHTNSDIGCMFSSENYHNFTEILSKLSPLNRVSNYLAVQQILSAFFSMFFYIPLFEFICSQGPQFMKGLLVGVVYFLRTMFQLIAVIFLLPFMLLWKVDGFSCGSGYYAVNIAIGLILLLVYMFVARGYKRRLRDEPERVYIYAERYYSSP